MRREIIKSTESKVENSVCSQVKELGCKIRRQTVRKLHTCMPESVWIVDWTYLVTLSFATLFAYVLVLLPRRSIQEHGDLGELRA